MPNAQPLAAEESKLSRLLQNSPARCNAMGYVNADALKGLVDEAGYSSEVAKNVDEFWFVADLDLMRLRPKWEAGYATLKQPFESETFSQSLGGYIDQIGSQDVIWSPRQTYFVLLPENRMGILRPADRRLLSGWLDLNFNIDQSAFLNSVATQPESFLSLMLAVEMKDAFAAKPLADRFSDFTSLKANPAASVASILASVQGATIIVGRESLQQCILTFDFARSPSSLRPIAGDLLAEILSRNGTAAPEVATWDVAIDDNRMTLRGPISESSLDGLLGLFSLRSQASQVARLSSDSGSSAESEKEKMGYTSKRYFDEVNAIVERTRKHKSQTTGALAKWNDQRARQIDELGTLNVDPTLIQFADDVSNLLRGNALTVRQGNIETGQTKATQNLNTGYYGGGYYGSGYYDANSTVDYQRVSDAINQGNAYSNFIQTLNEIDERTAQIRRLMTDKYAMQF